MNRKKFISQSVTGLGAGILASFIPSNIMAMGVGKSIKIKNVRLETGFAYDDYEITGTQTDLFTIEIQDGKIRAILAHANDPEAIDGKGYLMIPAMKDMHIHLDKTYYGGPWKARSKRQKSVKDMIALENELMPKLLPYSTERAQKLMDLLISKGTHFARSHVNIEPTSKLQSLSNLFRATEKYKDIFDVETVAFPQHGILYSNSQGLMKEAAQMGVDFIGGVDPASLDGNLEKTMDFTVQLALDYQKGIDIHLHETGESGLKTVQYLIDKVNENPQLKGKTFLSHCFILGRLEGAQLDEMATQLADAQIGIASTVPIGRLIMPIPTLLNKGVQVVAGTDSVTDHWQPFGTGSMLDKANRMAEIYSQSAEFELSRCLKIATNGLLPLADDGTQQWPKVGDDASFNLIDASCTAEAVARLSEVKALYHHGKCIYTKA